MRVADGKITWNPLFGSGQRTIHISDIIALEIQRDSDGDLLYARFKSGKRKGLLSGDEEFISAILEENPEIEVRLMQWPFGYEVRKSDGEKLTLHRIIVHRRTSLTLNTSS